MPKESTTIIAMAKQIDALAKRVKALEECTELSPESVDLSSLLPNTTVQFHFSSVTKTKSVENLQNDVALRLQEIITENDLTSLKIDWTQ